MHAIEGKYTLCNDDAVVAAAADDDDDDDRVENKYV